MKKFIHLILNSIYGVPQSIREKRTHLYPLFAPFRCVFIIILYLIVFCYMSFIDSEERLRTTYIVFSSEFLVHFTLESKLKQQTLMGRKVPNIANKVQL